jgi:hypothetical protein
MTPNACSKLPEFREGRESLFGCLELRLPSKERELDRKPNTDFQGSSAFLRGFQMLYAGEDVPEFERRHAADYIDFAGFSVVQIFVRNAASCFNYFTRSAGAKQPSKFLNPNLYSFPGFQRRIRGSHARSHRPSRKGASTYQYRPPDTTRPCGLDAPGPQALAGASALGFAESRGRVADSWSIPLA